MFTIGQLAARTGTTPRALRLYERRGLLKVDRTAAGRRVYRADHVIVLTQIRTLKDMGLTLGAIAALMRQRTLDAAELIELRLAQVAAEQDRLAALAGQLRAARSALADGPIDAASLVKLLADPATARFQTLLDQWFTPAEQEAWRSTVPRMERTTWETLMGRTRAAIAADVTPESPDAHALARDWYTAMLPMITAAGRDRWNRGTEMLSSQILSDGADAAVQAWLFKALPAVVGQTVSSAA